MTCVVGIADGTTVWIGSESCASSPNSKVEILHNKVFQLNIPLMGPDDKFVPMLIGGSGAFRLMQLLEYGLTPPLWKTDQTLMQYLVIDFTDAVRDLFAQKGFGKVNSNVETYEGDFLIGIEGQLFHMEESYQLISVPEQEYASGSGYRYAFGSLYTSNAHGSVYTGEANHLTPPERIRIALETAVHFDPRCGGPIVIKSIVKNP